ncbi:MAG TPA: TIGR00282 family metallophosphoesterase [Planctomycetes bacterium]|nr:TIGR00282 family metallophosphoesterase [Planctomycetota bacterium]HIN80822.1 TIGR00282 family metallophosphoesterase [Planctomycetota bacterium]
MKILIIGDIVGRPGRRIVRKWVPILRKEWDLDLVIANAENSAAGSGITHKIFRDLRSCGIDVMTMGDHSWKRRDNIEVFEKEELLLRPQNYPLEAVGKGVITIEARGDVPVGLVVVLGRVFMDGGDCPFHCVDRALESFSDDVRVRIVEFHGEATSEKTAAGWHLDGRISCLFGTHTHIPTADARVLPQGTAYITDIGMTGPYDGVIGRMAKPVLHKFITGMHAPFSVAEENPHLCGILLEVDPSTGKALSVKPVDVIDDESVQFCHEVLDGGGLEVPEGDGEASSA